MAKQQKNPRLPVFDPLKKEKKKKPRSPAPRPTAATVPLPPPSPPPPALPLPEPGLPRIVILVCNCFPEEARHAPGDQQALRLLLNEVVSRWEGSEKSIALEVLLGELDRRHS